ncbi:NAD(P)H-dependent oxidoreductase subunit E [Cetobacterium sp. SF1]|uniref:NAD(P)H-dependent oxidoreductase subunit E n=1 Tax=Cetobacterium sp. SF1 TaxID=3417654 RepID=UPI003CF2635B
MNEDFYNKLNKFIENLPDKKNDYKILTFVMEELGCIPEEVKEYICKKTDIFPFTLEGTIKFYSKLNKNSKKTLKICTGRVCGKRGEELLKRLKDDEIISQKYILDEVKCLGQCQKGPNIYLENEVYNIKNIEELIRFLREKE